MKARTRRERERQTERERERERDMLVYFSEAKRQHREAKGIEEEKGRAAKLIKREHIHGNLQAGDEEMQTKAAAEERREPREEIERDR